jgi:hypothetical protein
MSLAEDFRDAITDSWEQFSSLDYFGQRAALGWIMAAVAGFVVIAIMAWRFMVAFILLVFAVTWFLRRSRDEDSL